MRVRSVRRAPTERIRWSNADRAAVAPPPAAATICFHGDVVQSPAANTPGMPVAPRASTTTSPCGVISTTPSSHSVLGSSPICTKTPSTGSSSASPPARRACRRPTTLVPSPTTSVVAVPSRTSTLGRLRALRCSTSSALSSSANSTRVTCCTTPARSMAASTPELPPPTTATRLPLNSGPSQCGQNVTPRLRCSSSPGTSSVRQRAPLAMTTVRERSTAPEVEVHLVQPADLGCRDEPLRGLAGDHLDAEPTNLALEVAGHPRAPRCARRRGSSRSTWCRAAGRRSARRAGRCGCPCGRCRSRRSSRRARRRRRAPRRARAPRAASASRSAAPSSSFATTSSSVIRPWPKSSPLRKTIGTASTPRCSTSSGNTAPSMATWWMPGLSTAIRLSACTTSGQFWQDWLK